MFVAGIDGGGTHTRIEVRDMDNQLLRRGEFGPFNLNSIGEAAYRSLLREVFAWCGGMADCARLCVGAAGISNPNVKRILDEELEAAGFAGRWYLCGDQEIALRGAMDGPGVAVISGTGSICFGKNGEGRTARSGGFGHIIDDGGSGYALGRDVLSSAARSADGRAKAEEILREVCRRLGGGPEKIVPFVFSPETDKAVIAKFSHIALSQAEKGDPEAVEILNRGAGELYALVAAVQENLGISGCRIALLGGLIAEDNAYRRIVAEKLGELGDVIAPAHNALWGAAQMAWEL
jgi:N-acetylglucosamine kinase-like BadF-type ATPase